MATVTKVSVSYKRTHSLPGYGNVQPSVMMEADVGEGEDYVAIREDLALEARGMVEAMVDDARERYGLPAIYSAAPRYAAWLVEALATVFVVPEDAPVSDLHGGWSPPRVFNPATGEMWEHSGHRYDAMMAWVDRMAEDDPELAVRDWSAMAPADVPEAFWTYLSMHGIWARGVTRHFQQVKGSGGWRWHWYIGPAAAFRGIEKMNVTLFPSPGAERMDAEAQGISDDDVDEVYTQEELLSVLGERGERMLTRSPF
jgi:hypothetical protein